MNRTLFLRSLCIAAALLTLTEAQASTSIASLASEAGSSASDSASTSLNASSASSTGEDTQTANGDYRIINVAQVPNRPNHYRLTLRAEETPHEFTLDLPATTWTAQGLAQGDTIHAKPHSYGLEFARLDTQQAFFLVLHDDWHNELQSKPL
jgi:hypothetical protein